MIRSQISARLLVLFFFAFCVIQPIGDAALPAQAAEHENSSSSAPSELLRRRPRYVKRPRVRRRPVRRPTPRRVSRPRRRPTPRPSPTATPQPTITPVPTATPVATPSPSPTSTPTLGATPVAGNNTDLRGYQLFANNDPWNVDISQAPVDPNSTAIVQFIGAGTGLHPDFGTVWNGLPIGIPYTVVPPGQGGVSVQFTAYGSESDSGPYPIPADAPIEGGSDHHVLVLDWSNNLLYELFDATRLSPTSWSAASGAIFNVSTGAYQYGQRPLCWTSADAAGLAILPGLVRIDEVRSGEIKHALRFTVRQTQQRFVPPASHFASSTFDSSRPPMGARFRLKASFNVERPEFSTEVKVILRALKKYGMIVADNGSDWYLSGAPSPEWNDDELHVMQELVHGGDFEMIQSNFFGEGITGWNNCP